MEGRVTAAQHAYGAPHSLSSGVPVQEEQRGLTCCQWPF